MLPCPEDDHILSRSCEGGIGRENELYFFIQITLGTSHLLSGVGYDFFDDLLEGGGRKL